MFSLHPCAFASLRYFLILFLPLTSAYSASSPPSPVGLEAGIGYADYQAEIKPGLWYPVWATVQAKDYDLSGKLQFIQDENPLIVEIPIAVPKGTTKRYFSFFKAVSLPRTQPRVEVVIEAKRFGRDSIGVPLRYADERDQQILVLTDEPGAFSFLVRHRSDDPNSPAAVLGGCSVVYGKAELLPEDPIALEPLDAIILNGSQVRQITKAQWSAIKTWIAHGGNLLLAGGKHQPFIAQSNLKRAFGIELADPQPALFRDILAGYSPKDSQPDLLASWPTKPPVDGWSKIWIGDEAHPFLAGKRVGKGWFNVCASALDSGALTAINASASGREVWPWTLQHLNRDNGLLEIARRTEGATGLFLQRPFTIRLVGVWWVARYLGLYILLAVPVNWWVCGRLKRREWTWGVAVLLALGFAWYGYQSGARSQQKVFQVNDVSFVSKVADDPSARVISLSAVYSPRRFRSDISSPFHFFPSNMARPEDIYWEKNSDLYADAPLGVSFGKTTDVRGFFLYPWSARNLRRDFMLETKGGIEVLESIRLSEELSDEAVTAYPNLHVKIVNHTGFDFDSWYMAMGSVVWVGKGAIKDGETANAVLPSVMGWVSLFVRDAIKNGFPLPQTISRDGWASSESDDEYFRNLADAHWKYTDLRLLSNQMSFLGKANGSVAPILQESGSSTRLGEVFYEEFLPVSPLLSARDNRKPPKDWAASFLDWENQNNADLWAWWSPTKFSKDALPLTYSTRTIQIYPRSIYSAPKGTALNLSFTLDTFPQQRQAFHAFKASEGTLKESYRVAGCPVSVFNLRLQKWESLGVWLGKPYRLAPVEDYFEAESSALTLQLDLQPDAMLFRPAEAPTTDDSVIKSGKEIFETRHFAGERCQIMNIKVRLAEPETTTRGDQEGK